MISQSASRIAIAAIALTGLPAVAQVSVLAINPGSSQSPAEYSCTRITLVFTARDCSYGRTQVSILADTGAGSGSWIGPVRNGGYYAIGGPGDSLLYNPNDANPADGPLDPDDIKIAPSLSGTVTIDANGTPLDGSDDRIGMTFSIGPAARNIPTGQVTRAIERWSSLDHVLEPYAVDAASANAFGGFDYIIGARGEPVSLCSVTSSLDCFGSNAYDREQFPGESFWSEVALGSIGIERATALNDKCSPSVPGPVVPCLPNAGASTTATFQDYACESSNQSLNDCVGSLLVWGAAEDAGFDNLVGRISTDASGNIVDGRLYWTQEFYIGAFGAQPGSDNSWQGGVLNFTAAVVPVPAAAWLLAGGLGALTLVRRRRA
jgi:hypothetical protein